MNQKCPPSATDELKPSLDRLQQCYETLNQPEISTSKGDEEDRYEKVQYSEIHQYIESSKTLIDKFIPSPIWIVGKSFLVLRSMIHRAEEMLFLIEPSERAMGEALHDKHQIEISSISNRDDLLKEQEHAIRHLKAPYAKYADYFDRNQPWADFTEQLREYTQSTHSSTQDHSQVVSTYSTSTSDTGGKKSVDDKMARAALREVRRAFNYFQEDRWECIVYLRNQLIRGFIVAELVSYVLLVLVLGTISKDDREIFFAGVAFYVIGGIAGLFGRFFGESDLSGLNVDYGLSLIRLVATPLFSGLAGIAGVFIIQAASAAVMQAGIVNSATPAKEILIPQMIDIFKLTPANVFFAAVFGLTPNLVMQNLKRAADVKKPEEVRDNPPIASGEAHK